MRTLKLTLAYDGTAYAGWQRQLGRSTVQATLEAAIAQVTGQRPRTLACSRTDAGVHARGQIVGVRVDTHLAADVLRRALNATLPDDIAVLAAADVAASFHPLRDAVRKHYLYLLYDGPVRDVFGRRYSWHYRAGRLDAAAMHRAAQALVGTHDFRSFATSGSPRKSTVRTVVSLDVRRGRAGGLGPPPGLSDGAAAGPGANTPLPVEPAEQGGAGQGRAGQGDTLAVEVAGNGFLYNMVRTIVGTLVAVGGGVRPESWPGEVLRAGDRRLAGRTAPPQGLFLMHVVLRGDDG